MARMARSVFALALVALVGTVCGTEPLAPGTLSVQVQPVPALTTTSELIVFGTVTREPAVFGLPLVITIATPIATSVDTAAPNGLFHGLASLTPDANTIITVTASDASGSTSTPVTLSVVQDGTPPTVAHWSPANEADLIMPDAVVQVQFAEPIRPSSAHVSLQQNSRPIGGLASLSADSLTMTFVPATPLVPNAIYHVDVSGARDVAGNQADSSSACFVTGGALSTVSDPVNDYFVTATPPAPGTVPTDLTGLRFWWYAPITMDTTTLRFLIRYTLPRSLDAVSPANTFVALDFDLDQDSTTGVQPIKDLVLGNLLPSSGTGADYGILLIPRASAADSSLTVIWTGPLQGNVIQTFLPDLCGPNIGFTLPRSAIGVPVGPVHLVVYTEVSDVDVHGFSDAGPDSAYYTVPLPLYGAPRSGTTGLPISTGRPFDERTRTRLRQLFRLE